MPKKYPLEFKKQAIRRYEKEPSRIRICFDLRGGKCDCRMYRGTHSRLRIIRERCTNLTFRCENAPEWPTCPVEALWTGNRITE